MKKRTLFNIRMRASLREHHISGAEGIYPEDKVKKTVAHYFERAVGHPRGEPDEIIITVKALRRNPRGVPSLKVTTLNTPSHVEARESVRTILLLLGISRRSVKKAFTVVYGKNPMRGAAVLAMHDGRRLDPEKERGVRAASLGIEEHAVRRLSRGLRRFHIDTDTVREAIVLASKISSFRGVRAELCVSDDPDYTTGYVSSREYGYVRIPHIKAPGERCGGRVIFVDNSLNVHKLIEYLEKTPVLIHSISAISGEVSIHEFIGRLSG
jgi:6-carboxyhexanoate--CoA ligase